MLDKLKVIDELQRTIPTLFKESSEELNNARTLFSWLLENPSVLETIRKAGGPSPMPIWHGPLDATNFVMPQTYPYAVSSVDGSQIYPDKHQGVPCYLINSGIAQFVYDADKFCEAFFGSKRLHPNG